MSPRSRSAAATDELRASLVEHARALIAGGGPTALTMRALATEAGCAVGLPYKVFRDRRELVVELVMADFQHLAAGFAELPARAGTGTVADNLLHLADLLLGVPSVALVHELMADHLLVDEVVDRTAHQGIEPTLFEGYIAAYLDAERQAGRVGHHVDTPAIASLLFGALHNLLLSPAPHDLRHQLQRTLSGLASTLAP